MFKHQITELKKKYVHIATKVTPHSDEPSLLYITAVFYSWAVQTNKHINMWSYIDNEIRSDVDTDVCVNVYVLMSNLKFWF